MSPDNILVQVQTYQASELAYIQNQYCFISTANTRFLNFEEIIYQLGTSVSFQLPTRLVAFDSLVVTAQPTVQRLAVLNVNKEASVFTNFTDQQFIFNAEQYMEEFGYAAIATLGTKVEADVATEIIDGTYRFFGTPTSPINTFGLLATMLANFRKFGSTYHNMKVYLPMDIAADVVNSGLNQFTPKRNDENAYDWFIGRWLGVDFYQSNLLPTHVAGSVGQNATVLTLVTTNDPTGENITTLTFSGATANDPNAIKKGDLFQFQDGVGSFPNVRFLTFQGYVPTTLPFQFASTADVAADSSGHVVIPVNPVIDSVAGTQANNVNVALQPGMQVLGVDSHVAGLVLTGNAYFLGMPRLPNQMPYPTANMVDEDSGISIRNYFGAQFGQNLIGYVHDCVWAKKIASGEYAGRILYPI